MERLDAYMGAVQPALEKRPEVFQGNNLLGKMTLGKMT